MKPLAIPIFHTNTASKVYEYVRDCPGCTSRDISADLDMLPQSARMALKRLQNKSLVRTEGQDDNGLKLWWLGDGMTRQRHNKQANVKQETVTVWPAVAIEKQTPFSALFLSK